MKEINKATSSSKWARFSFSRQGLSILAFDKDYYFTIKKKIEGSQRTAKGLFLLRKLKKTDSKVLCPKK